MPEVTLPNGTTLAYDERNPTAERGVVLIHGISMSRKYFHKQLNDLSRDWRVVAVDLRGHGESEKAEAGHTVVQYARDLNEFIDAVHLTRPVLLGWSMGAFVAWDFIRQFGCSGLTGMVIVDESASDFKWEGFPHGFMDLTTLHALMTAVQDDRKGFLADLVPQMFHHEQSAHDVAWMVSECARLPIGPLSAILFDQSVQDYRDTVKQIDIPTLICWGRHDALLPASGAYDLHERIHGSRVELFEDSGHCPFIEESDRFNKVVCEFLGALH